MLEEHGPHLPVATDTIGVEYEAGRVADRPSQALPGWRVVLLPTIHYGSSGANQIGNVAVHPGTLRANAAYGREIEAWWVEGIADLILQAVRGENLFGRPRWPGPAQSDPAYATIVESALAPEREFALKFERWLGDRRTNR